MSIISLIVSNLIFLSKTILIQCFLFIWYALLSDVEYNKLNKNTDITTKVKILNLKYPTDKILDIIDNQNIFPAYHMNKKHWISVVLDKNIKLETIKELIDISYSLVK